MKKNIIVLFLIGLFAVGGVVAGNTAIHKSYNNTVTSCKMGEPQDTTKCDPHKYCTKDDQGNCTAHKSCCKSQQACNKSADNKCSNAKADSTCNKNQPQK